MARSGSTRRDGRKWLHRLVFGSAALSLAFVGWKAYQYTTSYYVSVRPGEAVMLRIETPMQRWHEHKNFASQRGLPVSCRIDGGNAGDGLSIRVEQTGHKVHMLWAKLRIRADRGAAVDSTHHRRASFTIADQSGWPEPRIRIHIDTAR